MQTDNPATLAQPSAATPDIPQKLEHANAEQANGTNGQIESDHLDTVHDAGPPPPVVCLGVIELGRTAPPHHHHH